ncbi:hypothetical protein VNO77_26663 [Canavalia gladiata]|uniref:Uncharacterized protein n=1 Tax=Canavalia gladiata TaxID=3824 RepID=A0AAN9KWF6_CANGL
MPRCGFFWLISYDGFCGDSRNPNNNMLWLVWRLQHGCSGVHGCLVPFDILNASRCIISSCWWFHPWFRCGVLWLRLILNMLRHGFHSLANDDFWGMGCLVMLDDGSWVNRETLVLPLMLEDWCRGIPNNVACFVHRLFMLVVPTVVMMRGTTVAVDPQYA